MSKKEIFVTCIAFGCLAFFFGFAIHDGFEKQGDIELSRVEGQR